MATGGQLDINIRDTVKLADPDYPTLEPSEKHQGWSVAKIWPSEVLTGSPFQEQRLVGRWSSIFITPMSDTHLHCIRNTACMEWKFAKPVSDIFVGYLRL